MAISVIMLIMHIRVNNQCLRRLRAQIRHFKSSALMSVNGTIIVVDLDDVNSTDISEITTLSII